MSLAVTPKKKICVSCRQEKGSTAFARGADQCTKCRNNKGNQSRQKSSGLSLLSCFSGAPPTPQAFLQSPIASRTLINSNDGLVRSLLQEYSTDSTSQL